jgi:RecB family exonuclease
MKSFEAILGSPIAWIADQLATLPARPARCAVVLVAAERQAHAIRRLVCVERGRPDCLAGVRFLRPVELARELLVRAGTLRVLGWEDVRRLRILQLFESMALADELRYFSAAQLRSGQGYVDAFARTIADLEASGLDAPLALAVAQRLETRDRFAADRMYDVAAVWQAADAGAAPRATTPQVLAAASALLTDRPALAAAFGPAFALLTASPSTTLLRFLRALPECRSVLQDARPLRTGTQRWRPLVGLHGAARPAPPPSPAAPQQLAMPFVDAPAPAAPRRAEAAGSELSLVQRYLFETPEHLTQPDRARSAGADGSVDLEEHPSIEDEVEAAAVWVTEQVTAGVPLEAIALIVPEVDPYAPLLADRLARLPNGSGGATIHAHVAGGLSLAASPAGMRLLTLFTALGRGLEAEATIRVLPALRRGPQGSTQGRERLSPSRAAEIVYSAGIVGGSPGDRAGLTEWEPRLRRRRDALRRLVAEATAERPAAGLGTDEPDKQLDPRARADAERWLRDVEPMLPAISALQALGEVVLAPASLRAIWGETRRFIERWLRVPADPPNLLARLDQALQPVLADAVSDAIRGAPALHFLTTVLHRERVATARFGEPCVFIGTSSHAAGLPFTAVRVLGLAEGALPHTPHDDPIVPDNLRAHIEEAARAQQRQPDIVLPRLADRVLDDIHDVFRVVSSAGRCLAFSAPRQWVDRSDREVSGIMLEVATALGRPAPQGADDGDVPTAARLRAAYLARGRAARLETARTTPLSRRALLTVPPDASHAGMVRVPAGWTQPAILAVDRVWTLATALDSGPLSEVDGVVTGAWPCAQPPGLVPERPISATALTTLLACPHRFLLERILYLTQPEQRPSTDVIPPIIYGSLFHAAAERLFREAGGAICRRQGRLDEWTARAREIAGEEFDALRFEYPMRGADGIARERERLRRQIEQLVAYEWHMPPREFLASELPFGVPEPVRLELDDGPLYVRGAIDRIDRASPAALSVRDLKTGRVRDFGEDPINAGRDLQIGLYVMAVEATRYGGAPVGTAAYVHPSAAQEPDRVFDGANLESLRRQTREWLGVARRLLSTGAFPRTPNADDCTYCPFVPACGEGAQLHSAAKLASLAPDHPLQPFVAFKRKRREDEE